MSTITPKGIDSSGSRDYTTIQAWNDAAPANLTTSIGGGEIWKGECYNTSEFASAVISGSTTDSTGYKWLTAAAGHSFQDDANKLTNPLRYDQAKGVGIKSGTTTYQAAAIFYGEAYFHMNRLQLWGASNNGICYCVRTSGLGAGEPEIFWDNIFESSGEPFQNTVLRVNGGASKFINNVVIQRNNGSNDGGITFIYLFGATRMVVSSCTFVKPSDKGGNGTAIDASGGSGKIILRDCAVFGWGTSYAGTSYDSASDYNATDGASAVPGGGGTHDLTSKTYSSQFEATADATRDFRAKSGADLINAGTRDQSNTVQGTTTSTNDKDIVGQTRSTTTPTIGAWEFVGGGGGTAYTLTATAGSVSITGTAASLLRALRLTASAGSVVITGTAATPKAARSLVAAPGSVLISGTASTLLKSKRLSADPGSVVISGTAASLKAALKLTASPGSVVISGTAASLTKGKRLTAAPGSFDILGTDANFLKALRLTASSGSIAITGTAAALILALGTTGTTIDGGRLPRGGGRKVKRRHVPARLADQHPDDIAREQRMLEEYLRELDEKKAPQAKAGRPATDKAPAAEPMAPRLTQVMAMLASTQQLALIARAELVAKEDREKAEKEHQRRRAAATAVLMMSH